MTLTRRTILQAIPTSAIAMILSKSKGEDEGKSAETIENNFRTILFQGDSITDAGRNRAHYYPNQGMGNGYVRHIVTELMGKYPKRDFRFYNRGISGNKVFQLRNRWEDDCLQLKPDVLSVMIGVNDFWHTLDHHYDGTAEVYEKDLDELLSITKKELPNIQFIIGQPFVCLDGTAIQKNRWIGEFEKYQNACKQIAQNYNAAFVPYQTVFDEALQLAPSSYWCPDGVHPSMAGNYLMAQAWLEAFAELD